MKIVIFGATGQTGLPLVRQAISDSEFSVKAMVRNVEKLRNVTTDMKCHTFLEEDTYSIYCIYLSLVYLQVIIQSKPPEKIVPN